MQKGYREIVMESDNARIVQQYYYGGQGAPGEKRKKKRRPTPEEMRFVNACTKKRKALWRLQLYFDVDDYYVTLTYRPKDRPKDMEGAKETFKAFREKLRKEYKKRGLPFKWIANIERGVRKACHIHLILNRFDGLDRLIGKLWKLGRKDIQLMYEEGGFRDLAAYITKSPVTDSSLSETYYSHSRNLPLPAPKVKEISGWSIKRKIRIPEGWYLDGDSLEEGETKAGFAYRSYVLLRTKRIKRGGIECTG